MAETIIPSQEVVKKHAQAMSRPVPKFIKNQVLWERDFDINLGKMVDSRLCVVKKVEWNEKGYWMVTAEIPMWPVAAIKAFVKVGYNADGYDKDTVTDHEDGFRALTIEEGAYQAP